MPDTDPARPTWWDLLQRAQQRADTFREARAPATHVNGRPWNTMPVPWRWHHCWGQSWGACGPFTVLARCPCGAVSLDGGPWTDRNSRRRRRDGMIGPTSGGENVGDDGLQLLMELRNALRKDPPS